MATCFGPTGSSSGLHYEPLNVRKLPTYLGSQQCLQKINVNLVGIQWQVTGHEPFTFIYCKHCWDPKDVHSFL